MTVLVYSHWYVCMFAMKCQQSGPPVPGPLAHGRSLTLPWDVFVELVKRSLSSASRN